MSFSLKIFTRYFFSFLILLFFYRILFHFSIYEKILLKEFYFFLRAYLTGLRFDISVSFILLIVPFILSKINYLNQFKSYKIFWNILPLIGFAILLQLSVGDIIYFENANKHIGYEGFAFLGKDLFVLYYSAITEKPILVILGFILFGYYIKKSISYFQNNFQNETWNKKYTIEFILVILITLIGIRGGIQTSAIRPSFAIISDDAMLNAVAINPVFTTFFELQKENLDKSKILRMEESILLLKESIDYKEAEFINPVFPIFRKSISRKEIANDKPNIVIVLLESWSAKFINSKFENKIITPNFNGLIKEGIYFNKFFATGGRTSNGLLSSLTGIPDRYGQSVLHFSESNSKLGSIAKVLYPHSYSSIFMTGSDLNFENIKPHIEKWGFQKIIDEKVIASENKYPKGIWGYDDSVGLPIFLEELDKMNSPFVATYLTISTHHPYKVPEKKFEIFDSSTKDFEYLNTLHYADFAIGEFIYEAKKKNFFENTIFFFLSDHTHHRFLNPYEDRNIPFLIYSPNKIKPSINSKIGTQLDLIPTILHFIGKDVEFSAMGKNLFSEGKNFSYFCFGNIAGFIEDENFHFVNLYSNDPPISFGFTEPFEDKKICIADLECKKKERKMLSYLNASKILMEKNLIYPY